MSILIVFFFCLVLIFSLPLDIFYPSTFPSIIRLVPFAYWYFIFSSLISFVILSLLILKKRSYFDSWHLSINRVCSFSLFLFTVWLITIKILFFTYDLEGTSYITLWMYVPFTWYKFTVLRKCLLVFLPDYLSMRREVYSRILCNPLYFLPFRKQFFQIQSLATIKFTSPI